MTDSSSDNNPVADMAGELMMAKMDAASMKGGMTHLLRLGSCNVTIYCLSYSIYVWTCHYLIMICVIRKIQGTFVRETA